MPQHLTHQSRLCVVEWHVHHLDRKVADPRNFPLPTCTWHPAWNIAEGWYQIDHQLAWSKKPGKSIDEIFSLRYAQSAVFIAGRAIGSAHNDETKEAENEWVSV
jgi:hypothetical protein